MYYYSAHSPKAGHRVEWRQNHAAIVGSALAEIHGAYQTQELPL